MARHVASVAGRRALWLGAIAAVSRMHSDPEILSGKPVVKGTRLPVEFLLSLFAAGWTGGMILESYPHLKQEDLRAVFAYAAESAREETGLALQALSGRSAVMSFLADENFPMPLQ